MASTAADMEKEDGGVDERMMVLAGFAALREPDGRFAPSVPLYRDLDGATDETDGLPWDALMEYFDELVRARAAKEKEEKTDDAGAV